MDATTKQQTLQNKSRYHLLSRGPVKPDGTEGDEKTSQKTTDVEQEPTSPDNDDDKNNPNMAGNSQEGPSISLAGKMVQHLADYVSDTGFADLPKEFRLLVTRSQDLTIALTMKTRDFSIYLSNFSCKYTDYVSSRIGV